MELARVELDEANVSCSSLSGLVTAGVWLRTGEEYFPGKGWDDFAVVIVAAWVDASLQLLRGDRQSVQIEFMDGPYAIGITRVTPREWSLTLVERRRSGQVERFLTADAGPLVDSLVDVSDRLVRMCQQRGWVSPDSERLAALVDSLRDDWEIGQRE